MLYIKDGKTWGCCIQNLTAEEQDRIYGPPVERLNSEWFRQRVNAKGDKPSNEKKQ